MPETAFDRNVDKHQYIIKDVDEHELALEATGRTVKNVHRLTVSILQHPYSIVSAIGSTHVSVVQFRITFDIYRDINGDE